MCCVEPAPTQTISWSGAARARAAPGVTFGAGNGATAPGLEAGRCDDLVRARDAGVARTGGRRDLRRVGAPVAGDEREHRPSVADEDDRLDDLRGLAADRARSRLRRRRAARELLEPHVGAALAHDGRDALHRLGPARALSER